MATQIIDGGRGIAMTTPFRNLGVRLTMAAATKIAKPLVIFVLGGPGAGKGTQCSKIVEVRVIL